MDLALNNLQRLICHKTQKLQYNLAKIVRCHRSRTVNAFQAYLTLSLCHLEGLDQTVTTSSYKAVSKFLAENIHL